MTWNKKIIAPRASAQADKGQVTGIVVKENSLLENSETGLCIKATITASNKENMSGTRFSMMDSEDARKEWTARRNARFLIRKRNTNDLGIAERVKMHLNVRVT